MALSSECVHLLPQGLYTKTLTLKLMILEGRALGKADGLEGCALVWGPSVLYKMHSAPTDRISVLVKETQKKKSSCHVTVDGAAGRFPTAQLPATG